MNEETTIVLDSEAHACIYDGAFMSRCQLIQYKHNDLDDLETLSGLFYFLRKNPILCQHQS